MKKTKIVCTLGPSSSSEEVLGQMLREYSERSPSWQIVLKSYMNVLIVKLLRKTSSGGSM